MVHIQFTPNRSLSIHISLIMTLNTEQKNVTYWHVK